MQKKQPALVLWKVMVASLSCPSRKDLPRPELAASLCFRGSMAIRWLSGLLGRGHDQEICVTPGVSILCSLRAYLVPWEVFSSNGTRRLGTGILSWYCPYGCVKETVIVRSTCDQLLALQAQPCSHACLLARTR